MKIKMKITHTFIISSLTIIVFSLLSSSASFAINENGCRELGGEWKSTEKTCTPNPKQAACKSSGGKWEKQDGDSSERCHTDTDKGPSLPKTIQYIIDLLLFLAGSIAIIVIVIAGLRYVTSSGDPQTASKAKNTIIYAVIGLIIAILSYAIVKFAVL
jgi:hypothetical protein